MEEIWKEIIGYEGFYEVSNHGRVKSLHFSIGKILKGTVNTVGYLIVDLRKYNVRRTLSIHQIVAEAFLGHKPCGYELVVNHKDFDKLNNHVDNLEIVSNRENTNKKHINSSSSYVGVSWLKKNKKWTAKIRIKGKLKHLGSYTDEKEASEAYQKELNNIKQEKL